MALALFDRVQEVTTTTGTGSITLGGAVSGFQSFAVVGNGNTCYYTILDGSAWEVGIGTYSTTGPTLARTTILSNSNGDTTAITLAAGTKSVFLTYPAEKSVNLDASGNVSPLGTVSSGTWQGTTVGVAYGGTGVTTSSGANSVVLRDSNQNIDVNRLNQTNTNITAAAGTTTLTAASSYSQTLVGTGTQTIKMPDATTLTTGVAFEFNNNATGTLTLTDYANATIATVTSGGAIELVLLANGTVAGTWDVHGYLPENVTWGTNALNLGSTVISGGTWQGGTIQTGYGGTGLTSYTSGGAVYANSTTTLTSGTLPASAGGTGLTSFTANGVVYATSTSALTTGSALTFDGTNLAIGTGTFSTIGGQLATLSLGGTNTTVSGGIAYQVNGTVKAYHYVENNVLNHQAQSGVSQAFLVNGSEQMRLTSTGLGIGTSSPSGIGKALNVYGGAGDVSTVIAEGNAGAKFLALYSGSATNDNGAIYSNQSIRFGYATSKAAAGYTNLMTLDTSGNLGLGVTPSAWSTSFSIKAFDISGGSVYSAATDISTVLNAYFNSSNAWIYKTTNVASRYTQGSGQHQWYTAGSGTAGNAITFTQAMTLDASGNFMLGATSPRNTARVTIDGTNDATSQISLYRSDSAARTVVGSNYIGTFTNTAFEFYTNSTLRATLSTAGVLGIGVTPSAWSSTVGLIDFRNSGGISSDNNYTYLSNNIYYNGTSNLRKSSGYVGLFQVGKSGTPFVWQYAGTGAADSAISLTEAMRLDGSGNLGLGVTPSAWGSQLRAFQTGLTTSISGGTSTSDTHITQNGYFDGSNWRYITTSTAANYFISGNSHIWRNAGSGTAGNAITFTQAMTLDASSNLMVGLTSSNLASGRGLMINAPSGQDTRLKLTNADSGTGQYDGFDIDLATDGAVNFVGWEAAPMKFFTSGSERMRLDSAGNLGLGATPSAWAGGYKALDFGGSGLLGRSAGTDTYFLSNTFYSSTGFKYLQNSAASYYAQFNGIHYWYNAPSGTAGATATFTQAMTLDASGNLLVGTTTSAYKTTAYVSGQDGFCVQNSATGTGTGNGTLFGLDSSSNGVMWSFDAVNLVFGTANTERMRITAAGNVGIGTSSPSANLHVQSTQASMNLRSTGTGNPFIDFYTSTSSLVGNIYGINGGGVGIGTTGGTERLRLDSSGNLGLGTTPAAWGSSGNLDLPDGSSVSFGSLGGVIVSNGYYSSGWRYKTTGQYAVKYDQQQGVGQHQWYVASTGTAGDFISFTQAMTLTTEGDLALGATVAPTRLYVSSPLFNVATFDSTYGQMAISFSNSGNTFAQMGSGISVTSSAAIDDLGFGTAGLDKNIVFATGTSYTERMRITSSGNVGIGTASPLARLQAQNGSNSCDIRASNSSGGYIQMTIESNATSEGRLAYTNTLKFYEGTTTERARIDSSGNFLVGTTSGTFAKGIFITDSDSQRVVHAGHNSFSSSTDGLFYSYTNTSSSTSFNHIGCQSGGSGVVFRVLGNGDAENANNSYGSISDIKLKENIVDASPKLADLMQVKIRNYNLIGDTTKQIGVVAQELEEVFPAMVAESPDRDKKGNDLGTTTKSVKYSVFVPMLIKALQEQQEIINQLKARLDAANL